MTRARDLLRTALHLHPEYPEYSVVFDIFHRAGAAGHGHIDSRQQLSAGRDERARFGV